MSGVIVESLLSLSGRLRTLGRPRGRNVDSKSRRRATDSTHVSLPKGVPRFTLQRTDANSLGLSASLTRLTQCTGQGDSNFGEGSVVSLVVHCNRLGRTIGQFRQLGFSKIFLKRLFCWNVSTRAGGICKLVQKLLVAKS